MVVENTEATRSIKRIASTIAIEELYVDKEFLTEMIKVAEGKRTSEDLRQEIIKQYAKR